MGLGLGDGGRWIFFIYNVVSRNRIYGRRQREVFLVFVRKYYETVFIITRQAMCCETTGNLYKKKEYKSYTKALQPLLTQNSKFPAGLGIKGYHKF